MATPGISSAVKRIADDPLTKVIDRQGDSKWRWTNLRQTLITEKGIDAELVDRMYANVVRILADDLRSRGEAWTISAAWWDWRVERDIWKFAHHYVRAGPNAPPYNDQEPTSKIGPPFSLEALRSCSEQARKERLVSDDNTRGPAYQHRAPLLTANSKLHPEWRKALWKGKEFGGVPHDADIVPEPGMVFIPEGEGVNIDKCLGKPDERANILVEAAELLGSDYTLAYGIAAGGIPTLVLDMTESSIQKGRLWAYKQVLLDLFEWQYQLLKHKKPLLLTEYLKRVYADRQRTGKDVVFQATDANRHVLLASIRERQSTRAREAEIERLVNEAPSDEARRLLGEQRAALLKKGRDLVATKIWEGIDPENEDAVLNRLCCLVQTKGPMSVLPAKDRQDIVYDLTIRWANVHIERVLSDRRSNVTLAAEAIDEFMLAPEQHARHKRWAILYDRSARMQAVARVLDDGQDRAFSQLALEWARASFAKKGVEDKMDAFLAASK
ncbi:hypothetical protein PG993_006152 [Apiospora rasikravindrae]|uniref:Type I-E CRISPR-associated protein Cse1/CasA n=1 Tax=Apiospora rasikravindrae TaxID=990691 RepID=A0ABR1T704_9PEZI